MCMRVSQIMKCEEVVPCSDFSQLFLFISSYELTVVIGELLLTRLLTRGETVFELLPRRNQ